MAGLADIIMGSNVNSPMAYAQPGLSAGIQGLGQMRQQNIQNRQGQDQLNMRQQQITMQQEEADRNKEKAKKQAVKLKRFQDAFNSNDQKRITEAMIEKSFDEGNEDMLYTALMNAKANGIEGYDALIKMHEKPIKEKFEFMNTPLGVLRTDSSGGSKLVQKNPAGMEDGKVDILYSTLDKIKQSGSDIDVNKVYLKLKGVKGADELVGDPLALAKFITQNVMSFDEKDVNGAARYVSSQFSMLTSPQQQSQQQAQPTPSGKFPMPVSFLKDAQTRAKIMGAGDPKKVAEEFNKIMNAAPYDPNIVAEPPTNMNTQPQSAITEEFQMDPQAILESERKTIAARGRKGSGSAGFNQGTYGGKVATGGLGRSY